MKYEILTKCCSQQYCDCFANKDGYCPCLEDTEFPKKQCPFYKERTEANMDSAKALVSLILRGKFGLIRRYHSERCLKAACHD